MPIANSNTALRESLTIREAKPLKGLGRQIANAAPASALLFEALHDNGHQQTGPSPNESMA
jgi:hypothetical protein